MARPGPSKAATSDATALPPVTRSSAHPLDRPEGPASKSPGPTKAPERKKTSTSTVPTVSVAGTGAPEEPPTEEELRKTPASERRQFNIGVPKGLKLHRRAGLYAEDHGLSRQDQVAIALDAWLRERGY